MCKADIRDLLGVQICANTAGGQHGWAQDVMSLAEEAGEESQVS